MCRSLTHILNKNVPTQWNATFRLKIEINNVLTRETLES